MKTTDALLFASMLLMIPAQMVQAEEILHIRLAASETDRSCGSQYSTVGAELLGTGTVTVGTGRLGFITVGDLWTVNTSAVLGGAIVTSFGWGEDFICHWEAQADYEGGVLRIYDNEDAAVDWSDPSTFADGPLVLEIEIESLHETLDYNGCIHVYQTTMDGLGTMTGGRWLQRFPENERAVEIHAFVDLESYDADIACTFGAFGFLEIDIAVVEAVGVERSSWGRLKQLY